MQHEAEGGVVSLAGGPAWLKDGQLEGLVRDEPGFMMDMLRVSAVLTSTDFMLEAVPVKLA